ncbi:HAMP domain-containing protein [Streptomyces sp. M10(2022)]
MLLGGAAVRLGLRPLTRVEHTARSITSGELEQNVTDTSPDTEVGRLGIAFNTMLDQLRAALHRKDRTERRLRRFMADAGHELRTPLTSSRASPNSCCTTRTCPRTADARPMS